MELLQKIVTKVYGSGRTQIPDEVRKELGLNDDDYVVWIRFPDGKWRIEKARI